MVSLNGIGSVASFPSFIGDIFQWIATLLDIGKVLFYISMNELGLIYLIILTQMHCSITADQDQNRFQSI